MGLIYVFVALPLIILGILGVVGLIRRKLIISSGRELSGVPMIFLSSSYILIAILGFIKVFYYTGDLMIDYPVIGAIVVVVTLLALFSGRTRLN